MPHEIGALAAELLKDPVKVSVTPVAKTADRVTQEVIFVEQQKKRALLVELFAKPDMTRTIVFTRTKRGADRVARHLENAGVPVAAIHGNKSQAQRDQAMMRGFKAGKIRALIATDIAARGIDVDAVSHVINYEIPNAFRRATCTVSGARRAPVRKASQSRSSTTRNAPICATSNA